MLVSTLGTSALPGSAESPSDGVGQFVAGVKKKMSVMTLLLVPGL